MVLKSGVRVCILGRQSISSSSFVLNRIIFLRGVSHSASSNPPSPHLLPIVEFRNATIKQADTSAVLYTNLNFEITQDSVWAVIGPVASGKSTFLEVNSQKKEEKKMIL